MKKILTIFLLIMIIICFYQITSMYALYKTTLEGEYTTDLGVWSIKLNSTDISSGGQNVTFTLSDEHFKIVESEHIEENKIAPGTEMYVELIIDPSNTDVSVIYDIDVKLDEESLAKLEVSKVENYFQKADGTGQTTNENFTSEGTKYTGIIPVSTINKGNINKIKLYFVWKSDETTDENDSTIGSQENVKISIPIDISIKQYMGENY